MRRRPAPMTLAPEPMPVAFGSCTRVLRTAGEQAARPGPRWPTSAAPPSRATRADLPSGRSTALLLLGVLAAAVASVASSAAVSARDVGVLRARQRDEPVVRGALEHTARQPPQPRAYGSPAAAASTSRRPSSTRCRTSTARRAVGGGARSSSCAARAGVKRARPSRTVTARTPPVGESGRHRTRRRVVALADRRGEDEHPDRRGFGGHAVLLTVQRGTRLTVLAGDETCLNAADRGRPQGGGGRSGDRAGGDEARGRAPRGRSGRRRTRGASGSSGSAGIRRSTRSRP